jgi:hypothetical protein
MKATHVRCAIYTRVSTDQGLDQEFNSLDAQYDASSAYIKSQAHAGWTLIKARYDDGGYSGGSTDRPDLQRLLDDIRARKIDVIVVYKVDRLTEGKAEGGGGLGWIMDREGVLRQAEPMPAEPNACVVCSPWPPEDRASLRESLAVIPLRAEVCEDWEGLPKGSLRSTM